MLPQSHAARPMEVSHIIPLGTTAAALNRNLAWHRVVPFYHTTR